MKPTIIARHKRELIDLVEEEVEKNPNCNLNHIDVSQIRDMSYLFRNTKFNGDISKWDVSNVKNMEQMFENSLFKGDLSDWKPLSLENLNNIFKNSNTNIPYWANFKEQKERNKAIDVYNLHKELSNELIEPKQINKSKLKL